MNAAKKLICSFWVLLAESKHLAALVCFFFFMSWYLINIVTVHL